MLINVVSLQINAIDHIRDVEFVEHLPHGGLLVAELLPIGVLESA